jgi:hypothetical protein
MFARSPVGFARSFTEMKLTKSEGVSPTFDIFDDSPISSTPGSITPSYLGMSGAPNVVSLPEVHTLALGDEKSSGSSCNIFFDKQNSSTPKLSSPIRRVHYSDLEGNEILPHLNPLLPRHFDEKSMILYGVGSLYTSLLPSLIVEGVGSAIASTATPSLRDRVKILMLNGTRDRETPDYTGMDFILAITDALNYSTWYLKTLLIQRAQEKFKVSSPEESPPDVDPLLLIPKVCSSGDMKKVASSLSNGSYSDLISLVSDVSWEAEYDIDDLAGEALCESGRTYASKPYSPDSFITHIIHLKNGEIPVDVEAIEMLGITCIEMGGSGEVYGLDELKEVLLSLMK